MVLAAYGTLSDSPGRDFGGEGWIRTNVHGVANRSMCPLCHFAFDARLCCGQVWGTRVKRLYSGPAPSGRFEARLIALLARSRKAFVEKRVAFLGFVDLAPCIHVAPYPAERVFVLDGNYFADFHTLLIHRSASNERRRGPRGTERNSRRRNHYNANPSRAADKRKKLFLGLARGRIGKGDRRANAKRGEKNLLHDFGHTTPWLPRSTLPMPLYTKRCTRFPS